MHPSSIINMKKMRIKYINPIINKLDVTFRILDVGGAYGAPERTYLRVFEDITYLNWTVCDIIKHPSVDMVMPSDYVIPVKDDTYDLVISGQMLEHCKNPFKIMNEMKRVLKPKHYMIVIAPSDGPYHHTTDCWRFLKDSFKCISEDIDLKFIESYIDEKPQDPRSRQWKDHVFVGMKK